MKLRSEFSAEGIGDNELALRVRDGTLERIRRGAYQTAEERSREARHLQLVRASLHQTRLPGAVVSHVSAAVVHGLPVDKDRLGQAHLVREGRSHSSARGPVRLHREPLVDAAVVGDLPVTTLATTVVTLARLLPFGEAVAIADAALRKTNRNVLRAALDESPSQRGIARARRVISFADPRAASAGESRSRALMSDLGLPMPDQLQLEVIDHLGTMYPDFGWSEHRVVGEFDGKIKYGRLLEPGMDVTEVVVAEKNREQRLRRRHWWTVRWTWDDLFRPGVFAAMIREELRYWERHR